MEKGDRPADKSTINNFDINLAEREAASSAVPPERRTSEHRNESRYH